jgi:hypothetical protein
MPALDRRFAVRTGLSLLVAAIPLTFTVVVAQASTSRLTIVVHVGYHDTVKLGDWMPVTVDVTNNGSDLDGTLEVQTSSSLGNGGPPGGSVIYHTSITLGAGATKHVRIYAIEDQPGAITVRVVQGGRIIASQQGTAANTTGVLIGVLSDQPATLNGLASINPGGLSSSVVHLTSDDLADAGLVLRPFDMLAIDDFATDTLTAGQRNALTDYVMGGGSLLLGTGGSWHKTLAGLPSVIVPMQVTGSTTLGTTRALGGASGVETATGTLAGGTAWLSAGNQPLLIEKPVGQGSVEMAAFDWNQDSIAAWSGSATLLRQAFVRSSVGIAGSPIFASGQGPYGNSPAQKGGNLSQVLANQPALDLPAWWLIGALVSLYVLLVGPINYFALRAVNRRALAWITVPMIAIVAAGGAYGGGILTKGRSVQANQVSIIHVEQGWDRAYQEAYTGIVTPTRGDYDVRIAGGRTLISPIAYYSGGIDPNQGLIRVDTTTDAITLPGMTAFTLRGFATEGITAAPQLVAHARLVGGKLTGTIQNLSSTPFTDAVVLAGNAYQTFGRIPAGASVTFSVAASVGNPLTGPPAYSQIYPSNLFGGAPPNTPSSAERVAETKGAILSMLPVNGFKGISLSALPTIVAWTDLPFQDLTVNGSQPRSYAETGIVLTLPIDQIAAGNIPAGVVAGRLVDIDGAVQSQGGPPGVVVLQSGSATYDFMPMLAPGLRLTGVSISNTNPFGSKGVVPPGANGSSATVKGQAWDWSQSTWVDISYQDSGTTSVPDGAVNPSTGEVRIKLSSDGQFSAGWLSLTGDAK